MKHVREHNEQLLAELINSIGSHAFTIDEYKCRGCGIYRPRVVEMKRKDQDETEIGYFGPCCIIQAKKEKWKVSI